MRVRMRRESVPNRNSCWKWLSSKTGARAVARTAAPVMTDTDIDQDVGYLVHPDVMMQIRKDFERAAARHDGDEALTKTEFVNAIMKHMPRDARGSTPSLDSSVRTTFGLGRRPSMAAMAPPDEGEDPRLFAAFSPLQARPSAPPPPHQLPL